MAAESREAGGVSEQSVQGAPASASDAVVILYTNYRGETAVRRIVPRKRHPMVGPNDVMWFETNDYHKGTDGKPEPQWFITAEDVGRNPSVMRDFALSGIKAWGQEAVDAALSPPPAVPESVRRLSEAATGGEWSAEPQVDDTGADTGNWWLVMASQPMGYEFDKSQDAQLAAAAVNYVRTLLSTPSGRADTPPARPEDDDTHRCGICDNPLIAGQPVLPDVELGTVHAACCGPERDSYVKNVDTGEPLGPDDPIPAGRPYEADTPPAGGGAVDIEAAAEIVSAAYYDAMIGQVPHTHGWAGKPEEFKRNVRARMVDALRAAGLSAAPEPAASGGRGAPSDGTIAHHAHSLKIAAKVLHGLAKPASAGSCDKAAAFLRSILSAPSEAETAGACHGEE